MKAFEWIPVEDELPEVQYNLSSPVLLSVKDMNTPIDPYINMGTWVEYGQLHHSGIWVDYSSRPVEFDTTVKVTHWMRIEPKKENDE